MPVYIHVVVICAGLYTCGGHRCRFIYMRGSYVPVYMHVVVFNIYDHVIARFPCGDVYTVISYCDIKQSLHPIVSRLFLSDTAALLKMGMRSFLIDARILHDSG